MHTSHIRSAHFTNPRSQNEQICCPAAQKRPQDIEFAHPAIPRTQNEQIRCVRMRQTASGDVYAIRNFRIASLARDDFHSQAIARLLNARRHDNGTRLRTAFERTIVDIVSNHELNIQRSGANARCRKGIKPGSMINRILIKNGHYRLFTTGINGITGMRRRENICSIVPKTGIQ